MTQVMTHMSTAILQPRAPVNGLSDEERICKKILICVAHLRACGSLSDLLCVVFFANFVDDGLLLDLWLLLTRE